MALVDVFKQKGIEKCVCPRCEAKINEPCTTTAGKKTDTHVPRWEPLLEAFMAGQEVTSQIDPTIVPEAVNVIRHARLGAAKANEVVRRLGEAGFVITRNMT